MATVGDLMTLLKRHDPDCILALELREEEGYSSVMRPEITPTDPICFVREICEAVYSLCPESHNFLDRSRLKINLAILSPTVDHS